MAQLWSDERKAKAAKLWREGHSAAQIARMIGALSRNAVIGAIHRMGLSGAGRAQPTAPVRLRPIVRTRKHSNPMGVEGVAGMKARVAREIRKGARPSMVVVGDHVTLADLEPSHCRWPITDCAPGDGDKLLFCCQPRAPLHSYCPEHQAKAWGAIPTPEQRAKAAKDFERENRRWVG